MNRIENGDAPSPPPEGGSFTRLDALALAATLLLGLLNLPFPFTGDQAFFTVGALEMDHGKSLYRDFWDLKPPGIFLFYFAAGKLFGFTEIGVRAFELLFMTAFAALLTFSLRRHVRRPIVRASVPLLTVGVYYTVTWCWHLTQVEGLVGPWLFLCLWLSTKPFGSEGRRGGMSLFAAGVFGGIAVVFKLLFAPIVAAFALIALVTTARSARGRPLFECLRDGATFGAGVLLPMLAVGLSFAFAGTLPLLLETSFVIPSRIAREIPGAGAERLKAGLAWFLVKFGPLLPGVLVAIGTTLKRRDRPLRTGLVLWLIVGMGVIQVQRQSLWEYHYLLLFVPMGLLALFGLEDLLDAAATRTFFSSGKGRWALPLACAILLLPFAKSVANKGLRIVRHRGTVRAEARRDYRIEINPGYEVALRQIEVLRAPGSLPGDIFVCGDPLFYFLSGRAQATTLNGWSLEFFLSHQWTQLRDELDSRRPPYVFVSPFYRDLIAERSPALARLLGDAYTELPRTPDGTWFVRR